ncbi:MAG: alanine racemase [Nitrospirae bacterium]|nr:alanine racemase [Nitrospirota bacterium]
MEAKHLLLNPTFAEVKLKALSNNLRIVKKLTRGKAILSVVKASAYGHGAVTVSKHLIKEGVSALAVAFLSEAIELRNSGIKAPIVVLFDYENAKAVVRHRLTPVIYSISAARELSKEALRNNLQIPVHIKIDTGMGRLGFKPDEAVKKNIDINSMQGLRTEGIMSHFSDAVLHDKIYAEKQLGIFKKIVRELKKIGIKFKFTHIANSAAILSFPESHLNMVRPGLMLYGYSPFDNNVEDSHRERLMPALSLKSKILFLKRVSAGTPISYGRTFITGRNSLIATIPIGYADGYSRSLSNQGEVLIRGKRAPVVGRVCMDLTMVDVTHIKEVNEGDEVVIIGKQGNQTLSASEITSKTGTITYEVLTSIGSRIPRVYISG